jgi:hypothetical protein
VDEVEREVELALVDVELMELEVLDLRDKSV